MGTYLPFPRWKGLFFGVLVDLLEPSLELLALFWPPLGSTWLRCADMQNFVVFRLMFIVFSMFFSSPVFCTPSRTWAPIWC